MATILAFSQADSLHWLAVLLDAGAKGLVILLAAAVATRLLRRGSAALRHMIWTLSVIALVCVPVLSVALPQLRAPILPDWAAPRVQRTPVDPPTEPIVPGVPQDTAVAPAMAASPDPLPYDHEPPVAVSSEAYPAQAAAESSVAAVQPAGRQPLHWSAWVLLVWAAGAGVMALPVLVGTVLVWWRVRRAARITDESWLGLLKGLSETLGIRTPVRLLRSTWPNVPLVCGVLKPVIVLPAEADDWSAQRRRLVLLHELAHVKRGDCLTQLITRLTQVLYWFNPLVWLAGRMLRIEREQACDDLVLASGHKASDYASHLLALVRTLRSARCPSPVAVAMVRKSQFEGRLLAILDATRSRRALTRVGVLVAAILIAAVVVPMSIIKATAPGNPPATQPGAKDSAEAQLRRLWVSLGSADSTEASEAVKAMVALGDRAVAFVAERFYPAPADAGHVKLLIAKLDDAKYALRKKAYDELMQLGRAAEPALKEALKQPKLSVEARAHINGVVENWTSPAPGTAQARRFEGAVQVLAEIGTPGTGGMLRHLAREGWFPWGKAVEGVQVRLRGPTAVKEYPYCADVRNMGARKRVIGVVQQMCEVEIDGKRFPYARSFARVSETFDRGGVYRDIKIGLDSFLGDSSLTSGRHTLRVAFIANPVDKASGPAIRVLSNALEFEVDAAGAIVAQPRAPTPPATQPAAGISPGRPGGRTQQKPNSGACGFPWALPTRRRRAKRSRPWWRWGMAQWRS